MIRIIWLVLFFPLASANDTSIYISKTNTISFFAGTPVEDINAENTKSVSLMNIQTGEVTISIPNKEFHFKRALMEEHFNENYMESDKFPKSEFKGKIQDIDKLDLTAGTPISITVSGILTIHGVAKIRTLNVTLQKTGNQIKGETKFTIPLADHRIDRPQILWEKLAENVDVTANFIYEPYTQNK